MDLATAFELAYNWFQNCFRTGFATKLPQKVNGRASERSIDSRIPKHSRLPNQFVKQMCLRSWSSPFQLPHFGLTLIGALGTLQ
jgi:hypothetical protein